MKSILTNFEKNEITVVDRITGQANVHSFEVMIGADGVGSKIRQALIPIAGGESSSEFLDHDYKELEIPVGPNGLHQIERSQQSV